MDLERLLGPDAPVGTPVEVQRDGRISEIFYYFEDLTTLESGRTVGRKIGVVQEILLRKYLEQSDALKRRMYLEQSLTGISGAAHKVEFSWYKISQRVAHSGGVITATVGSGLVEIEIVSIDSDLGFVKLQASTGATTTVGLDRKPIPKAGAFGLYLSAMKIDLRFMEIVDGQAYIDVVDKTALIASLESKRVGAQRFSGSNKLGAGIQTIEKAKQASLVAIDLDIAYNGTVKPLGSPSGEKQLLSFVALGNGVHWNTKDKAVLGTFVDFTFLVKDAGIIRYADYVQEKAPEGSDRIQWFMDYFQGMTKQKYDDFQVTDSDFSIIVPEDEERSLLRILEDHILTVDPQNEY
jgi:hypothetical protein